MVGAHWLKLLAGPVIAALWGAMLGMAHLHGDTGFLERIESSLTDLRLLARGTRTPPDAVTIVAVDDRIVSEEKSYPLPRATLARIIDTVAGLGPSAIAVDILLVEPGPGDGDELLAQALARRPSVIAAAATFPPGGLSPAASDGPLARVPIAERILLPAPLFAERSSVGIVNVATDRSGTPRSQPLLFRTKDGVLASLPLRAASLATATDPSISPGSITVGSHTLHTDLGQNLPLSFYGPRGTIRTVSAADLINGAVDPAAIENRVVVVGVTVTGGGDVFPTPFDSILPGVEVVSTAISHLLTGDGPVRDRTVRLVDAGIATLLPALLVGLLAWQRNVIGLAAIALVLVVWAGANFFAFEHGVWMSATLPLAAAAPPALLFGTGQLWLQRRRAHLFARQSSVLQSVQAPGMAHLLAEDPDFLKEPVRQTAAAVFVDLSGFTTLSESVGATATREFLDAFYQMVAEEATANGGAITSFMGDGAMILFGLPTPSADDPVHAARCCVGLSRRLAAWLATTSGSMPSKVGFKIGAHTGVVVASRLGQGRTQQIAATGDTVNVAARLMDVAARFDAHVAVSDDFLKAAGHASFENGTLAGPFHTRLRGRARSLPVWTWSLTQH